MKRRMRMILFFLMGSLLCGCQSAAGGPSGDAVAASKENPIISEASVIQEPLVKRMYSFDENDTVIQTWDYEYDEYNRRTKTVIQELDYEDGEFALYCVQSYQYMEDGTYQMVESFPMTEEETAYTFDGEGREIKTHHSGKRDGKQYEVNVESSYSVDETGAIIQSNHTVDGDTEKKEVYNDKGDLVLSESDSLRVEYDYEYDGQDQMVRMTRTINGSRAEETYYEYDPASGLLLRAVSDPSEKYLSDSAEDNLTITTYTYDDKGRLIKEYVESPEVRRGTALKRYCGMCYEYFDE